MGAPRVTVGCKGKARRGGTCSCVLGTIERNDGEWWWQPKARPKVARRITDRQVSDDHTTASAFIESEVVPRRVADGPAVAQCAEHGITWLEQDDMLEWIELAEGKRRPVYVAADPGVPWQ